MSECVTENSAGMKVKALPDDVTYMNKTKRGKVNILEWNDVTSMQERQKTDAISRWQATFSDNLNGTQIVQCNVKDGISMPTDKCGKHHNRPHAIQSDVANVPSHNSRNKSQKEYVSPDLYVAKMHRTSMEKYLNTPVSRTFYQNIFHDMNIQIGTPRIDTCRQHDLLLQKEIATENKAERHKIDLDSALHHTKAENAYKSLKEDEEMAKKNSNVMVLCVYLQQVLFCSTLSHSSMFYQRRLSCYDFVSKRSLGK
ncbi:hypothetical protein PR048_026163 [Dryococelus australis]|uniref:Uncharacterized protein n=1 Tax=Dryococelus australis TaxID=614101 RepID=A0ABQ9GKM7_9NEOP|nr:hypothetical protein PR048_026163 [Dryococelus australis]